MESLKGVNRERGKDERNVDAVDMRAFERIGCIKLDRQKLIGIERDARLKREKRG